MQMQMQMHRCDHLCPFMIRWKGESIESLRICDQGGLMMILPMSTRPGSCIAVKMKFNGHR